MTPSQTTDIGPGPGTFTVVQILGPYLPLDVVVGIRVFGQDTSGLTSFTVAASLVNVRDGNSSDVDGGRILVRPSVLASPSSALNFDLDCMATVDQFRFIAVRLTVVIAGATHWLGGSSAVVRRALLAQRKGDAARWF